MTKKQAANRHKQAASNPPRDKEHYPRTSHDSDSSGITRVTTHPQERIPSRFVLLKKVAVECGPSSSIA